MPTLYLRGVPDEVVTRLRQLANLEGMSVTAFAVRELAIAARRADNRALLADLADLAVAPQDVIADLEHERERR